jgi:nitroimidazol reductase NimA-like FMN-containing flavoprotein (pyridoxamine 5'-phosphate oxidase superfamily)
MNNQHVPTPTEHDVTGRKLHELTRAQSFAFLRTVPIGRVGISRVEGPLIHPVNFIVLHESVVFRTVPSLKLWAAAANATVAFEADAYASDGSWGWTVLITGTAEEVTKRSDVEELRVELLRSWAFPAADRLVRIAPERVTGRGFGQAVRALAGNQQG